MPSLKGEEFAWSIKEYSNQGGSVLSNVKDQSGIRLGVDIDD